MSENLSEQPEKRSRIAAFIGITLAVLAGFLISISVDTYWLHERVFDTDNFVESLAPLPKDPAISTAIATKAAGAFDEGATIERRVAEALPEQLAFLTPKFVEFTQEFVFDTTMQLVASDAFATLWTKALRTTHTVFIGVLEGDTTETGSGHVGIELDGAAGLIISDLEDRGIDLFADVEASLGEIVLIQTDLLAAPRSIVGVFHTAVWVFPVVALVLVGVAIVVDRDRFRPIQWFGFTAAIAILASLGILRGAVNAAGRTIESDINRAAADAVWTALLDGYVRFSAIVGLVMLAVGLAALWWRHSGQQQAASHKT